METDQEPIETSGDEHHVVLSADANGDGRTDVWMTDTTGDGTADLYQFDTTGDGRVDVTIAEHTGGAHDSGPHGEPAPVERTVVEGDGGHPVPAD